MTTMLFGQSKLKHCHEKNWQMKSGTKREAGYAISTIPRYLWLDKLIKQQREDIWLEPWNKGTIPDCIDHILKHDVRAHGFSWVRTGFNVLSIDLGLAEMGDMGAKFCLINWFVKSFFFRTQDVDVEICIFCINLAPMAAGTKPSEVYKSRRRNWVFQELKVVPPWVMSDYRW